MKISHDQKGGGGRGGERERGTGENGELPIRSRIDHLRLTRDCLIKLDSTSANTMQRAISFR